MAAVPYMGWNTYYGVGGVFDEQTILSVARSLLDRGLAKAGYRIVWLDFGWASGARDGRGELIVDRRQWPHGLRWLTGWLHGNGLLAGIYTDAGASGCSGQRRRIARPLPAGRRRVRRVGVRRRQGRLLRRGPGRTWRRSRRTWRSRSALADNSSRRRMLLNVGNFWVPGQVDGTLPDRSRTRRTRNYRWAPRIAQSWRTDTDIGFTKKIEFVNVLRNLDHDAAHPAAAGPGHWNDPDYLGPGLGMTPAEARAQLSMWAIVAAPLILGSDPRTLSAREREDARRTRR